MRYERDDRVAGLSEELPVWEDIDPSHDGLRALGLTPSQIKICLLYTSPSPRDVEESRMPSSA